MAGIRLITLDLDDTLWPCNPPLVQAEARFYAWLQAAAPEVSRAYDLSRLRAHRLTLREQRPELAHDITALRRESLRLLLRAYGCREGLAEEGIQVFLAARQGVTPYADVAPVLAVLRGRYRLVSLTNGNADVYQTQLGAHFHQALSAAQVGASKPAPALFLAALEMAGVTAAEALHLGDDPELDMMPAAGLGMRTAWMNRSGQVWPAALTPPDTQVQDLYGLQDWLECNSI